MQTLHTYTDVKIYLEERGFAPYEHGINWTWANFPTNEAAYEFHSELGPEFETRGVYKADPESTNPNLRVAGVRFRL